MGRVRTKTVKRSARALVEKYYSKLGLDFHNNKRVVDDAAVVPSKRVRNMIAGFTTHLMRRLDQGQTIKGISLKLQEEERERRMDYIPSTSAIDTTRITVDPDTKAMLEKLELTFPVQVKSAFRPRRRQEA